MAVTNTLIVGLGSPHGDDNIGWVACELLEKELGALPAVEFITCDHSGVEWLSKLPRAGRVFFIDAMKSGGIPGAVRRINLTNESWGESHKLSSHGIGFMETLDVARSLGDLPEVISVWAVEIGQCDIESGLSQPVKKALPGLLEYIKSELQQ